MIVDASDRIIWIKQGTVLVCLYLVNHANCLFQNSDAGKFLSYCLTVVFFIMRKVASIC